MSLNTSGLWKVCLWGGGRRGRRGHVLPCTDDPYDDPPGDGGGGAMVYTPLDIARHVFIKQPA